MTLAIAKNYAVADLISLSRLVLRFVYEPDKMRTEEINLMQESLQLWAKKIKQDREKRILTDINNPNSLDDEEEYVLNRIAWMLRNDAAGKFETRKAMFKEYKVDWRKFHRLPDSYTPEDFFKAQQMKQEYDKKYPEFR